MYKHILIPVAPDHFGEYAKALTVTRKLIAEGGRVSVLTVLEQVPSYIEAYIPDGQIEKNKAEVSNSLVAEFQAEGAETHVMIGHSANSILDWAEENDVDCIVVLSHRPGFSDYFIGSTAARIVRHAKCAVHVLR